MKLHLSFQKDLSNRMLCWCQKAACSITFITRHVVGHSSDGTKLALQRARNVICKCAALLCCYLAESHCSLASSSFAVQSTLKVREILGFYAIDASLVHMSHCSKRLENELNKVSRCALENKKKMFITQFISSFIGVSEALCEKSTLTTLFIYSFDIFQFIFEFLFQRLR